MSTPTLRKQILDWLWVNRTAARLAFVVRLFAMAASSILSLVWTPLLLKGMGDKLYGIFFSFAVIPRLGGLGDLGISGAIGVRTGQMLGRNESDRLKAFLSSARAMMLMTAPFLALVFFVLSPWMPRWFNFETAPGAGSLTLLFQTGAIYLFVMIAGGYVHAVNSGFGNVLWPVLPSLFISQVSMLGHWLLARAGAPLWVQNLPYIVAAALTAILVWWLLKLAHPWLADLRPITMDWGLWRELVSTSGWIYLFTLGHYIFTMTDRLLINAGAETGLGAEHVPGYMFNYKPCELALQVVGAACVATQAKINQWMANPAEESQQRVRREIKRLCAFQSVFAVVFALGYFALNHRFISLWVGDEYHRPLALQWAFALTLVVTSAGDAGIQTAALCGRNGLRAAGMAIGVTGLLNLILSFIAMKAGSLIGIAFATVIAQTVLSLFLSWYSCRHLKLSFVRWALNSWALPVAAVLLGASVQNWIGVETWKQAGIMGGIFLAFSFFYARMAGINREFIESELKIFRAYLKR